MYGHPGIKLLFMGGEFAQRHEWQHDFSLDWHENYYPLHHGIQTLLQDLNNLYKTEPSLSELNFSGAGFEWIDINDAQNSVISWIRKGHNPQNDLIFIANFTPVVRRNYRVGMPKIGYYQEIFNSDNSKYGGSNVSNNSELETAPIPKHNRTHSLSLTLPPLGLIVLKHEKGYDWLS
jgi:1,4-alpha-glucan branching enzyme